MALIVTKHIIDAKIRPVGAICFRNYRDEIPAVYQDRLKKLAEYHMKSAIGCPTNLHVHVGRKLREWLAAGNEITSIEKMNVSMHGPTLEWSSIIYGL